MGLFDSSEEHPPHKVRRYVITALALLVLALIAVRWFTRYRTEQQTIERFMNALVAGQAEQAYHIWKPTSGYAYEDFMHDWGPSGGYGPVRSFRIEDTQRRGSCVVITVDVSPDQPFPDDNDGAKQNKIQQVQICVLGDQTMSFAP
ncbi:MAG: hypothetical protein ACRD50_07405 [Candidatus Acidiferrales bacterium]